VARSDYPAPTILVVLAAGCVGVGRPVARPRRRFIAAIILASLVETAALIRIGLPLVSTASLHSTGLDKIRQDFADAVGWPELTAQVGADYRALPAAQRATTAILTSNYGEAGAIDIYGPRLGLPQALSGHLSFWYWKPSPCVRQHPADGGLRGGCAALPLRQHHAGGHGGDPVVPLQPGVGSTDPGVHRPARVRQRRPGGAQTLRVTDPEGVLGFSTPRPYIRSNRPEA
jgi:hypothetical protein